MPFTIVRQDITQMKVDAIVNAANTQLLMGGGVCGAIFSAAGARALQAACDKAAPIPTGGAAITPGFQLPSKYVIHAAGPVYSAQRKEQCAELLRSAYTESLKLAAKYRCESIAFPLISSGIYGYPKEDALQEATSAIREFLDEHDMDVYLAVFDKNSFAVSKQLAGDVASYIDEHYVNSHCFERRQLLDIEEQTLAKVDTVSFNIPPVCSAAPSKAPASAFRKIREPHLKEGAAPKSASLEERMSNLDEPFSDTLLELIDSKGKTDVEIYKKANLDRKLFSKIRSVKGYTPKKATILALAIALELTLDETDALLERAGYALSHASKFDVIVEYFIVSGKYNIFDINEVLFHYGQPLLGG